jgi:GDPmannose 4,6-dehydratase
MLRGELYTKDGQKRIPKRILNAAPYLQVLFLSAYNRGDGLRAGHGIDQFKAFRTTSPVLAAGLTWLARTALGRRVSIYRQKSHLGFDKDSYLINLNSGMTPGNKGAHLRKPQNEIRKVDVTPFTGWMCDLATETGRFAAGVGLAVVHNSPRRGETFVTRKITRAVARIKAGRQEKLYLGNLDAKRDWGYAPEYCEAMYLMLQQDHPDDYVIATGEAHTPREFCELAFDHVGLDWNKYVEIDQRYFRPSEVDYLMGDASKARKELGWEPRTGFEDLVRNMVDADIQLLDDELAGRLVRQDRDH